MNVVVLAGGVLPVEDPMFDLLPEGVHPSKAHLDLGGKPMLQWVLDALAASDEITGVVLVGQDEEAGFSCLKPMTYLPDQGGLLDNALVGLRVSMEKNPDEKFTLLASGDIPLLTTEMVDWVVENGVQTGADLIYHVITDEVMEARFPGSNRTFVSLKGMKICGGDLNLVSRKMIDQNMDFWEKLAARRKNPLRQAALLGPGILLGVGLRIYDLDMGVAKISKRLGLVAKAVICPYAELGMDIDKPHQYKLVKKEIEGSKKKHEG